MVKCFTAATIFVDNYSWLGYVHLQYDLTSLETLRLNQVLRLMLLLMA
jgi:hypothetical protein